MHFSGKTTLLNKVWGLREETGELQHTDVPGLHEVHENLVVVDFPGYDGIEEHHAEAFDLCASMNNLLVLVVRFAGDVNDVAVKMVAAALRATAASSSGQVLVCMNKCGEGESFANTRR